MCLLDSHKATKEEVHHADVDKFTICVRVFLVLKKKVCYKTNLLYLMNE